MQKFLVDVAALQEEWEGCWELTSKNLGKRLVVLSRVDTDDGMVVSCKVSSSYPAGQTVYSCNFEIYDDEDQPTPIALPGRITAVIDKLMEHFTADPEAAATNTRAPSDIPLFTPQIAASINQPKQQVQISAATLRHLQELQALCSQLKGPGAVFHEPEKQRILVDVGVGLQCLPSLRCRAIGLDPGQILVTRLAFPATGASSSYWSGHESVKVEKVFTCIPDRFGRPDADSSNLSSSTMGAMTTTATSPVPWYLRARMQDSITKNQLALQQVEAQQQRARAEALQAGLASEANKAPPQQGHHNQAALLFSFPEESFYNAANLIQGIQNCVLYRLNTCTSVCLVCDGPLGYAGSKVGICSKDLCQHTSHRFGINTDLVTELTRCGIVCELLLNLTRCAATSGITRDTFEPMCPVNISDTLALTATLNATATTSGSDTSISQQPTQPAHFYTETYGVGTKDFALIGATIDSIPSIDELVAAAKGSNARLKEYLNKVSGPLAYPLLQWVISSNHAHVEPVPPQHKIPFLGTDHQFYLVSDNPEKERQFREYKRRAQKSNADGVGSFYAWHGSSAGNWHCILRNGLRNYSGTRLMSTGQVYGAGVYFAKSVQTSVPYMGQPQRAWANSHSIDWMVDANGAGGEVAATSKGLMVISLCEVIKAATGWKDHENSIITVQDENLIATRLLFVYPHGQPNLQNVPLSVLRIPTGIFDTTA